MPSLLLACLTYLGVALPASALGLLWPSMRITFHVPVGDLGILLIFGTTASVLASAAAGRMLSRTRLGPLLAAGTLLTAVALAAEALAPWLWTFGCGIVLFGLGFGAIDSALNAHAASHFGARDINWMHASYGLGATVGPLLVTGLLDDGLGWRLACGVMVAIQAALATMLALCQRAWRPPAAVPATADDRAAEGDVAPAAAVFSALAFAAVQTGIESGAGIWGYLFLTAGRALAPSAAGVAVSAYWAMMFAGRAVLGPVAQRLGPSRVLAAATACVPLGAAVMTVPGPRAVSVAGLMIVGLASAPVFPLLALTTGRTTRMVSLQVAASAIGGAAVPAAMGLAIGAAGAVVLAPSLLVLGLATCGLGRLMGLRPGR